MYLSRTNILNNNSAQRQFIPKVDPGVTHGVTTGPDVKCRSRVADEQFVEVQRPIQVVLGRARKPAETGVRYKGRGKQVRAMGLDWEVGAHDAFLKPSPESCLVSRSLNSIELRGETALLIDQLNLANVTLATAEGLSSYAKQNGFL